MNAGEQLQNHLERFFALRQHGDDALFLARLGRVQAFQRQRLMDTHQALLEDPALRPGVTFLLDDVYGGPYVMSVFGRPVSALRSLMWDFSVSCMGINMSFVCESILETEGRTRPSDEQVIAVRASFTEYLIATQVTRGWPVDGQL